MARSKNSPALFEVIRNAQQKQKEQAQRQQQQALAAEIEAHSPAAALLRSPLYWFKGKQAHEAAKGEPMEPVMREMPATPVPLAAVKFAPPPAYVPAAAPIARPIYIATPASVADELDLVAEVVVPHARTPERAPAAPAYVPATSSAATEAARQVREELAAQDAPAAEPLFASPVGTSGYSTSPFGLDADEPHPTHYNLRFNTTTAIVAGFAVVVAFTVFYIIGTAGSEKKPLATAAPINRDVLNVTPRKNTDTPIVPPSVTPPANNDEALANLQPAGTSLALATIGKPIPVPTNVKRVIGNQYLVLMSFPPAMEQQSKDIVKYLAQNGVPVTAEKALPGYAKSWTSIVTVCGFDHTKHNPAFDAYSSAIKDLLAKNADSKFRRTFRIDVYAWRAAR